MSSVWVKPDIRDEIVSEVKRMKSLTGLSKTHLIQNLGIYNSKFKTWENRFGKPNEHNSMTPKGHQISPDEYATIVDYAKKSESKSALYSKNGYKSLTYMMIDSNIAFASPSSVYRILKKEGLLNQRNSKVSKKGDGYKQPTAPHQEWHIDIKYMNYRGRFLFFIGVLDGFSRYIVHHEVRESMTEYDVEITLQKALEKSPGVHPKVISDNGKQFTGKDFENFIREMALRHVRISPYYPQSNGKLERFHKSLGDECLKGSALLDIEDARKIIAEYVKYYNEQRLHHALSYLTPKDVLEGKAKQKLNKRKKKLMQARQRRLQYWKSREKVA